MFNKQNINAEQELSVMTVMGIYLHLKRFHACNGCGKMIVVIIFFFVVFVRDITVALLGKNIFGT